MQKKIWRGAAPPPPPLATLLDSSLILVELTAICSGIVHYDVKSGGNANGQVFYTVEVVDHRGDIVARAKGSTGSLRVDQASFWWPFTMSKTPGYL